MASGINGQIPAPILRWREGDTVTLSVINRLGELDPLARRKHAVADGRGAGFSFRGIAPGETFVYRFPVKQNGTYRYHRSSHVSKSCPA
jgi:FtsP/CotA-like multicopper oxidase with cupredoxin domain